MSTLTQIVNTLAAGYEISFGKEKEVTVITVSDFQVDPALHVRHLCKEEDPKFRNMSFDESLAYHIELARKLMQINQKAGL